MPYRFTSENNNMKKNMTIKISVYIYLKVNWFNLYYPNQSCKYQKKQKDRDYLSSQKFKHIV